MALENLKISDDRSQELAKKMKEVKVLDEATSLETTDLAKNAIASLDNPKLATFIETQFKSEDKRKSFAELTADPMYVFTVQSSLDALGYDALLTGGDTTFGIDEVYGSRTKAAVIKFQEDAGLAKKDGLVGEETFAALVGKLKDPTFTPQLPAVVDADAGQTKVERDANGKLLVDSYGNTVHYVTSIDQIPITNFNTPAWGNTVYVINGYTVYGNGRVIENKTRKMYNWIDIKDVIVKILPNQSSVLDTEPFGSKTFDAMVPVIQDAVINKLGKDALGYTVSISEKSDPSITVKITKDGYSKSHVINLNGYQNDAGLDVATLKKKIVGILASAKELADKTNERDKKMKDWITSITGTTYGVNTLFPGFTGKKLLQYKAFFSEFDQSMLKITKASLDNNTIVLDFYESSKRSFSNSDKEYLKGIVVPLEKIFDADGNPKPAAEQLKVLAAVVKNIIEDPKNGYVA